MHGAPAWRKTGRKGRLSKVKTLQQIPVNTRLRAASGARGAKVLPAVHNSGGTIHGFQGDECDAIIAVFNPPPNISANPQMFLNRQNILNVAISRARDYLFIIMPDEQTENIQNLRKVSLIESLVKERTGAYSEWAAHQLEEVILGSKSYLEDNTFSTGHQMVNVYKRAERHYEVRCDESAIDVQISVGASASE